MNNKQSKYGRVDNNQKQVVQDLRKLGYSVLILSNIGKGCPDLLIGKNGINKLVELKDEKKTPSKRKLTPDEAHFFQTWRGQVHCCKNVDEIIELW